MAQRRNGASCAVAPLEHATARRREGSGCAVGFPRGGGAEVRHAPLGSGGAEVQWCELRRGDPTARRRNGATYAAGSKWGGGAAVQPKFLHHLKLDLRGRQPAFHPQWIITAHYCSLITNEVSQFC